MRPAARWVLLARSGCALISASRNSSGARSTTDFIAANSSLTPANGRSAAACSAIHGEYSKTFASAATKSSLLQMLRSESLCNIAFAPIRYRMRCRRDAPDWRASAARSVAGRHPDPLVLSDVVEKPYQRRSAAGTADDPAMQADRHHLRRGFAFPVKDVKAVLEIGEEFIARRQSPAHSQSACHWRRAYRE